MILTNNKYYILRVGDFATNANTKIYYGLFTFVLCFEEYITNNRTDCFHIMTNATIIWTIIEFFLHYSNTRIIKPMYLNYNNYSVQLPTNIGIFLQGFQEGGCITTIGLYFGDRLYIYKYCFFLHVLILFITINVLIKTKKVGQSSKRHVNSVSSLSLMGAITLYDILILYRNPLHFQRQMKMFFVMIYVCSFWTTAVWYKGFRKVKVYTPNHNNEYISKKINYIDTFIVLSYDIIFEIGMAYLYFYNISII